MQNRYDFIPPNDKPSKCNYKSIQLQSALEHHGSMITVRMNSSKSYK